jgi:hypothetical protein
MGIEQQVHVVLELKRHRRLIPLFALSKAGSSEAFARPPLAALGGGEQRALAYSARAFAISINEPSRLCGSNHPFYAWMSRDVLQFAAPATRLVYSVKLKETKREY